MKARLTVTLADIAEAAQVSVSTVSRILNQRDGSIKISQATQERVLEVARQLGYEPNPFASALRTQQTGVLGVIIRDISDPFLSLLVRALQKAVQREKFELLIGHAEFDLETARRQLQVMLTHWFDGLFLLGNVPGDDALLQTLEQRHLPFVALACGAQVNAPLVTVDDALGTRLALEHLYELGHRRIAFLGDIAHAGVQDRLTHFMHLAQEYGLSMEPEYIQLCSSKRNDAVWSMYQLLDLRQPPTALFCAADLLALGALNGLWQRGKRVPEDLSLIGFDDIEEASEIFPTLTTIRQPVQEMAQKAVNLLRTLMTGAAHTTQETRLIVQPELMVRASCAPYLRREEATN